MNLGGYVRTLHVEPVTVDEAAPMEETPQVPAEVSRDKVTETQAPQLVSV